jgi:hypothetical protein
LSSCHVFLSNRFITIHSFDRSTTITQPPTDRSFTNVRALVRRQNVNSTKQPMYPMSVVNNSFTKHLEAKAIEAR